MKKIYITIFILLFICGITQAVTAPLSNTSIYRSSFTRTADTNQNIINALFFRGIIVSSATPNGSIALYDNRFSTSNPIGTVDLGALGFYPYDIWLSSGLTYTTINSTNGVTILYKKP